MRKKTSIKIDPKKLRHAILVRNMSLIEASEQMGFNKAYLNNCMARSEIAPSGAILLEKMFSVEPHEYQVTEPEPVKAEPVETPTSEPAPVIDYVQLYNTVYAAMLAALSQNAKEMREHLFDKPSERGCAS